MKTVISLMNRNRKLFFRDKGMFFSALITPFILIVLYATFLAKVYKDSFTSAFPEGFTIAEKLIDGTVAASCRSLSSKLCNSYILRESYNGSGQGEWYKEGLKCFTDKSLKDISWIFPCNSAEFIACKWAGTCDRTSLHRKNGLVFKLCGCALDYY